jgi:hypothetical protein
MARITDVECCNPMTKEDSAKQEARWRAECDLDVLMNAEKIKKDKTRLRAALSIAKERKAELNAVAADGVDNLV